MKMSDVLHQNLLETYKPLEYLMFRPYTMFTKLDQKVHEVIKLLSTLKKT
jgi:hypothetical protein